MISLNGVGETVNQSYGLKRNVRPFYVNQSMSLVKGLEFLRGTKQPSRYSKIYLVCLQLSEDKQRASGRLSCSPAGSVHCAVSGDFCDSSSITSNHGDDSQNSLATITT